VAGNLGKLPLADQNLLMTADQVLVTIPFGIGVATSVRVGGFLGAKDLESGRRSAHVSFVLTAAIAIFVCLLLILTRNHFPKIFTGESEVVRYVALAMP
jgi:MATE family multidrug resistance protein